MKSVFIVALSLIAALLYSQPNKLNLASDVWPPFTDVDTNHAFALDLVREALARDKVKAPTTIIYGGDIIDSIRSGQFDGSAALWHSPERAAYLLYSEPYLENHLILVGKKGSDVSAKTLSELKGKRVAVVKTYAYGPLMDEAKDVKLVAGSSDQQNLQRLLNGEVDYMLTDALLIQYLLKYQSEEAAQYLEIGINDLLTLPLYFALRKEIPGAEKIINNFNEEIREMIAEGTYNRILQLNWISTDVDGDGRPDLLLSGDKAGTEAPEYSYSPISNRASKDSRYYIEGNVYDTWDEVPEKYKVPQAAIPDSEKRGFGPVLIF